MVIGPEDPEVLSGQSARAVLVFDGVEPIELGEVVLISGSSHRDARRVLEIGTLRASGMTRGPRAVAGTLAFTTLHQDAFNEAIQLFDEGADPYYLADELPPFNLIVGLSFQDQGYRGGLGGGRRSGSLEGGLFLLREVVVVDIATQMGVDKPVIGQQYGYVAADMSRIVTQSFPISDESESTSKVVYKRLSPIDAIPARGDFSR